MADGNLCAPTTLNNAKITKSARHQMPRNKDKMPRADADRQATYLHAKGAYAVRQTCAKTPKFTMYITHVVSVCTFIHVTPVFKLCTG